MTITLSEVEKSQPINSKGKVSNRCIRQNRADIGLESDFSA